MKLRDRPRVFHNGLTSSPQRHLVLHQGFTSAASMQITAVKVHPTREEVVRAYVDIRLGGGFMIRGLKVIRQSMGYLVAMPSRKWRKRGSFTIAFPTTEEARRMVEAAVMAEYGKVTGETVSPSQTRS